MKIANNCEKATFMIEKKKFSTLSFTENLELRIHLAGCEVCRIYQRQSKLTDKVAFNFFIAVFPSCHFAGSRFFPVSKKMVSARS